MLQALKLVQENLEEIITSLDDDPRNEQWVRNVYDHSTTNGHVVYFVPSAPTSFMDVPIEGPMFAREDTVLNNPEQYEIIDHL